GMGSAPRDVGWLVYFVLLLNGLGVLLPWNMFMTIAPQYYVTYWFTGPNGTSTDYSVQFMATSGLVAQVPNLLVNIVNIFLVIGGSLLLRLYAPLILNCLNVLIVLILVVAVDPSEDAMGWFYIVTLVIVAVLNASNGLYQNTIFGICSDFPPQYTNAVVLGNNVCGIFIALINIACTEIFDNVKTIAIIYFSISLASLVACAVLLVFGTRTPFYKHYIAAGEKARAEQSTEKPSFTQYVECFKSCWVQLFCVFFTFFVSLSLFPSVMVKIPVMMEEGEEWSFFIPEKQYVNLTTFLNFNLFAFLGSLAANFIQFPSERFLWIPVLARVLFIPFFMFMNYSPETRTWAVLLDSPWYFIPAVTLLALSHGYLYSLGMMYTPKVVPPHLSMIAGKASAMCLILGITCACAFVFAIEAMIRS
ncbi:hypothetical protein PMAYCL1PPCAC_08929, partial [Pristionchus mayeri]